MFTTAFLLKWLLSLLLVLVLMVALVFVLKFIKNKNIQLNLKDSSDKLKLIDQLYLDSKNKIVKIKDGENILTILLGSDAKLLNQEKKKEDVE